MARSLASKTNVNAPGGNYPYGRVRDESLAGANDGTPVDEELLGDALQFFEKLMAEAGESANGFPENSSNGFQYFEALEEWVKSLSPQIRYGGYTEVTSLVMEGISAGYFEWGIPTSHVEINLSASDTRDIVSFGTTRPLGFEATVYFNTGSGGIDIILNSTNAGALPIIILPSVATNDTTYSVPSGEVVKIMRTSEGWVIMQDT